MTGRLAAWADETLEGADRREVDDHLDGCPPCRHEAVLEQGGRGLLRARRDILREPPLPPGLRSRCEALLAQPAQPPLWRRGLIPATLAAGLGLFALVAVLAFATHRSPTLLAAQLTADHLKCALLFGPEVVSAEAAEIEALLWERFGWRLRVPPSSDDGAIQLVGARRCLYTDGTVPHVMYRAGDQDVSLYMVNGPVTDPVDVVTLGHRSHVWSQDGVTFVVVAADGELTMEAVQYLVQHPR